MIEKEAGFLSAQDIGFEAQSIFQKDNRPVERSAVEDLAVLQAKIVEGLFLNIAAEPQNQAAFAFEQTGRFIEARQPCRGVKFEDARGVILIQNQPRPAVVFPVDAAKAGCLRIEQAPAKGKGFGRVGVATTLINCGGLPACKMRTRMGDCASNNPTARKRSARSKMTASLAGCARPILPAHTLRKDPRMPPAHDVFRRRRDAEAKTRDLKCRLSCFFTGKDD